MEAFMKSLPKAELHLHIEGSFEPELMFAIAQRNDCKIRFNSVEEIKKAYNFSCLQDFLDIYYEGAGVLLKEQDFYDLTYAYLQKAAADGVVHTEIFFDPQTHTDRKVPYGTVVKGIKRACDDAEKNLNITSYLIPNILRHLSEEEGLKTLESILDPEYRNLVVGLGLDSSEQGHPPKKFANLFAKAKEAGLRLVAHAGEEGPAQNVWDALNILKVERVDHGVRSTEDPELVKKLAADQVPLTMCPLSNTKLCVYKDMKDHCCKTMLAQGCCVTINSDDPAYFGGYILDNFVAVHQALDLSPEDAHKLCLNSINASWLPAEKKEQWKAKLDAALSEYKKA
eukprot:TRINITY_DN104758_c0_g1_i1.p1 TRINITY_DN104758_c0_g1~~TRINITY_DN104758_c0_g1_i1.p1  ORF type:complete len:340 (+),score=55.74 TRINITY_DN104758_c0_g1_i1:32-1051(+)